MRPRISLITLGVDDLEKSVAFWRDGMGLATEGVIGKEFEHGAVAFFDLNPGLKLALWARADVAFDTGLAQGGRSPTELTLAHNVASRAEVDEILLQAQEAGATLLKPAANTFYGGYAGYFQDLDGHVWEIAWNPAMLPTP